MKSGIEIIREERARQILEKGYDEKNDDTYLKEELSFAAASYCLPKTVRRKTFWPWHPSIYKPGDRIRELAKAGALISAEIDRLNRRKNG